VTALGNVLRSVRSTNNMYFIWISNDRKDQKARMTGTKTEIRLPSWNDRKARTMVKLETTRKPERKKLPEQPEIQE